MHEIALTPSWEKSASIPNQTADSLYTRAREKGKRNQLWSSLPGRSKRLLSLDEIAAAKTIDSHRHAGLMTVPICRIRGSESRVGDFDCDFNPLHDHNKGRWLSVAGARQRGQALPPVALIQIGDLYFVRDGHHRISVARALGQKAIEATVEVWRVEGPLPWDAAIQGRGLKSVRRPGRLERFMATVRHLGDLLNDFGAAHKRPAVPQPSADGLKS